MTGVRGSIKYREIFFAHNGAGPYDCTFCGKTVLFEDVHIHHVDHDRFNDELTNLVPAHRACHTSHHHTGFKHSPDAKSRIKDALRGVPRTEEHKQKISAGLKAYHAKKRGDECTV